MWCARVRRFGMHAQIGTVKEPKLRVQIVTERASFDENPAVFKGKYQQQQEALTAKIVEAQQRLKQVGGGEHCCCWCKLVAVAAGVQLHLFNERAIHRELHVLVFTGSC
jgi:Mg-chelatase subunit ChlI